MYNYKNSKANIINILKSKTPIEKRTSVPADQEFTYENGISCWVSAIFIDIENSSELFKNKDEKLARLMRAFTSEVITIFQDKDDFAQIGIRGDCVYSIYSIETKDALLKTFLIAVRLNTFMKMFNKIITDYGYDKINAGIGLGYDEDLIIKAGRSGTGINDKIWIGKAVVDAANLSSIAGRNGIDNIAMSSKFHYNVHELLEQRNRKYKDWLEREEDSDGNVYYHCDVVQTDFNNWIDEGMK